MAHFRGRRALKTEFAVTVLLLIAAVIYAVESREFFLESLLEENSAEFEIYKDAYDVLEESSLSRTELEGVIEDLEPLNYDGFVLQDDVKLGIAEAHERLSEYDEAEAILVAMIEGSSEEISTTDAAFLLSALYEEQGEIQKAARVFEENEKDFANYRRNERYQTLLSLYYQLEDFTNAGKSLCELKTFADEQEEIYLEVLSSNWVDFDQNEKSDILTVLSTAELYEEYAQYAQAYIEEYLPGRYDAEAIAVDLVYNSQEDYVADFIEFLSSNETYSEVTMQMDALYSLSGNSIEYADGKTRGLYYKRKLKALNGLYSYSSSSAVYYYNLYLEGDMDIDYTAQNLVYTIRNLLAFQEYEDITNIVEQSYSKHGIDSEIGSISEAVSFWNGYAHYMLSEDDRALEELENCIAKRPDGYYAVNAKDIILTLLDEKNLSLEEYLSGLDYTFISTPETIIKLRYAKILFAFREGYSKMLMREKVVELLEKLSPEYFFEFDENAMMRLYSSKNYLRFVIYTRYGFEEKAKWVLSASGIEDENMQDLLILQQYVENEDFSDAQTLAWQFMSIDFMDENFAFLSEEIRRIILPTPYETEIEMALAELTDPSVDKHLVYGIIRQESMYIDDAKSWAGAMGLMQLMPATADWIADKVWDTDDVDYYNPVNNIMLGTRYIHDNVNSYGLLRAVAAYNGGYSIIKKAQKKFDCENDYELMEVHPYTETRNYVKKVLTNYYRYLALYGADISDFSYSEIPIARGF